MTIDLRTRIDPTDGPDPQRGSRIDLATIADQLGALGTPPPVVGTLEPLDLLVEGLGAWRVSWDGRRFALAPATRPDAATTWTIAGDDLADLLDDQVTPIGLMTSGRLHVAGRMSQAMDWWLTLRAALDHHGWSDPAAVAADLPDLTRSFTLDDDPREVIDFLDRAGFVHLRGVWSPEEMATISADMDRAAPTYSQGDGRSWWAKTSTGDRLVRMQGFDRHSAATAELLHDDRLRHVGDAVGLGHVHEGLEGNLIEALFKPIGVTEGISDIPWHKDCSLGRHSYECCSLTCGISVTGAGPGTGQLRVIAGSHRVLVWPALMDVDRIGLPDVALATEVGDLTVHLSCTLHMAEPPTLAERRVLYTSFRLPALDDAAARAASRRLLSVARESAPLTTSQPSAV